MKKGAEVVFVRHSELYYR